LFGGFSAPFPPVVLSNAARLERQQNNDDNEEDDVEEAEQLLPEEGGAEVPEALAPHPHHRQARDVRGRRHQPLDTLGYSVRVITGFLPHSYKLFFTPKQGLQKIIEEPGEQ
jgi:hypothetical protein